MRSAEGSRCNVCETVCFQSKEAEGDSGDAAAAGEEHEQPPLVAFPRRGRAVQTRHLQRLSRAGNPEEAG